MGLHPERLNILSLCTGGGGLDRAVELAIPQARTVLCVEREAFAVAALVAQIENGLMAPAAVWSDVRTFPGRRFRGRVDGLIGGIPCQPHSLAGRRGGSTDERDLWSPARRIIAQARPWFVLIENVGGFVSAGADEIPGAARVRGDLRKLGFQSTLVLVRADQMGLPHERLRAFILGVADWFLADAGRVSDQRRGEPGVVLRAPGTPEGDSEQRQRGGGSANGRGGGLADAKRIGRGKGAGEIRGRQSKSSGCCEDLGDAKCSGPLPSTFVGLHRQQEGDGARDGASERPDGSVVDAVCCRRDGRPEGALGEPVRGAAEQQPCALCDEQHLADRDGGEPPAQRRDLGEMRGLSEGQGGPEYGSALSGGGRPFLRPPAPGDVDAWRHVALVAPGLLPAVSRYDRLRLEMGAQGFVAAGDPPAGRAGRSQARKARRGAGQGASAWVDAGTGERLGAADVQAAVERAVRGVADVMATRIDELRMLGNGVADAQGALAVRIGLRNLHASGSPGAAFLLAMMGEA